MPNRLPEFGVRGRLLLAFFAISAFGVLGGVAALLALSEVGEVFDRVARERMPAGFAALELSRQTERIASAAPTIVADKTQIEQMRTDRRLRRDLAELESCWPRSG